MIERIHLEIIQKVNQTGTLTAAAKELNLTQSALSHSIKKIEASYGVHIWQKEGRMVKLTQAGTQLLKLADQTLSNMKRSEEVLKLIAEGKMGAIRIGMESHPCYEWGIRIARPFIKGHPHVDIDIKQQVQCDGVNGLLNNQIDLLITPDPTTHDDLMFHSVFEYELVAVAANEHPLVKKKILIPSDFQTEELITYPLPKERLDIFTKFLSRENKVPKYHRTMESTELMLQLVACNRGLTIMPDWLAQDHQQSLPIQRLRLGARGIKKSIYLGIRQTDADIQYLHDFLQLAKQPSLIRNHAALDG